MFKLEFKELPAITLVMGVLIVVMALLGTNPISNQPLDLWVRIALGVVSILLISIALLLTKKTKDYNFPLPTYQVKHNKSINLFNIIEKTFLEFGEKNKDSVIFASKGNRIISQGDIGKHVFFIRVVPDVKFMNLGYF